MADKQIMFKAPMVKALLAGRKSMTRRILKPQPDVSKIGSPFHPEPRGGRKWVFMAYDDKPGYSFATADFTVPYAVGDRLWCREKFSGLHRLEGYPPSQWLAAQIDTYDGREIEEVAHIWYWADGGPTYGDWTKPKSSRFMPKWASRLTLVVTDVKVERLMDISEEDARAEGAPDWWRSLPEDERNSTYTATGMFRDLWSSIHGPSAWSENPWIAAIPFTVHQRNILDMGEDA